MRLRLWTAIALTLGFTAFSAPASAERRGDPPPTCARRCSAPQPTASWEAFWGNRWWPVEIVGRRDGLTKIHYTGWGNEWDEWVEQSRLRKASPRVALRAGKVGQRVDVEWHGTWWDGQIIAVRGGLYKVHYVGWGSEWDEWVEPIRLRKPSR